MMSPREEFLSLVQPEDHFAELAHSGAWESFYSGLLSPEKVESLLAKSQTFTTKAKGVILHALINNNNIQYAEALLLKENDENIQREIANTRFLGEYPIHRAFDSEAIELLKKFGADLDVKDKNGDTAIVLAAKVADWKIVSSLVKQGAKVEEDIAEDQHSSNTALAWAHLHKNEEMVKFLQDHGARNEGLEKIERRSRSSSVSTQS